jgi:hypothetical protein
MMPPGASPEATLEAARQLLHNPPGPHASLSVVEQWHHDINQLVVTAMNTMPHGGRQANHPDGAPLPSAVHSRSPMAPLPPTASHALVANLAMADLWAELKCLRSGEDSHITIERHRERCRNLDGDFSAPDTTPVRQAAQALYPWRDLRVPAWCLPAHLRMVIWPRKFWLHLSEKYDRSLNPA